MYRSVALFVPLTVVASVALAGCGSSTSTPAAASTAAVATSSAAASTSAAAAPAGAGTSADAIVWAGKFCTSASPLLALKALNTTPDTSSPAAAVTSAVALLNKIADVYTQVGASVTKVGPPPAGSTTAGVDAINASATKLRGLAATAATADPTNVAALTGLQKAATDALASIGGSFDALNNTLPVPVKAALVAAPECKVFAG